MFLEDEDVKEFQTIYQEVFGETITEQEAGIMASQLIAIYEVLAYPLPSERAQFADSTERVRLKSGVGADHVDKLPTSVKVVL